MRVVGREPPEGFAEFVAARSPALLRTAWLLTGDATTAQDLVQESLAKTWNVWDSIQRKDRPEVYVRTVMVNVYTSWWRRRWRGELATDQLPEPAYEPGQVGSDPMALADVRLGVRQALATLAPRQRAVVVLRFYDDLTEAQTADALGCSIGTVKSQTARALARLRASPYLTDDPTDTTQPSPVPTGGTS